MNATEPSTIVTADRSRRLYFLLTSSGAAASQWLASTLDRHPEFCCTCGPWIPASANGQGSDARLVGEFLLEGFQAPEAPPKPVDDLFDNLETFKSARVYGNIHAETVTTFAIKVRRHPVVRPLQLANVIRHPIPRTASKFGILTHDEAVNPAMARGYEIQLEDRLHRFRPLAQAIADQIGNFMTDPVQRTFMNALFDTVEGLDEFRTAGVSEGLMHFQIEQIRSDREVFRQLILFVTGNAIEPDDRYLSWALSPENLSGGRYRNAAASQRPTPGPEGQWRDWSEWQRRAFQTAMVLCSLHEPYEQRGYDFSFVEPPSPPAFPGLGSTLFRPRPVVRPKVASPSLFNQRA